MSKERQLNKQEEIKNTILDAARKIVAKEGLQGLSIRKITKGIDYSPSIVYHYFKDKNEIIEILLSKGYNRIVSSIGSLTRNEEEPEKEMKEALTKYINAALEFPKEYKAFVLNEDPNILKKTALLHKDVSQTSQTMKMLCDNIERGIRIGRFRDCDVELMAQIIWTSTFGLIIKIIIENNLPKQQIDRLINKHFKILFNGVLTTKQKESPSAL